MNKHFHPLKFTIALSTLSVVQQILLKTQRRDNISDDKRSTSKNSSQVQELNLPNVLLNSSSRNTQSLKSLVKLLYL